MHDMGRRPISAHKSQIAGRCVHFSRVSRITRNASAIKCSAFISSEKRRSIFKCVPLIVVRNSHAKRRNCALCILCCVQLSAQIWKYYNFDWKVFMPWYSSRDGALCKRNLRVGIRGTAQETNRTTINFNFHIARPVVIHSGSRYPMAYICMPNVSFVFLFACVVRYKVLRFPVVVGAFCTL